MSTLKKRKGKRLEEQASRSMLRHRSTKRVQSFYCVGRLSSLLCFKECPKSRLVRPKRESLLLMNCFRTPTVQEKCGSSSTWGHKRHKSRHLLSLFGLNEKRRDIKRFVWGGYKCCAQSKELDLLVYSNRS